MRLRLIALATSRPVSYTHLDVYKRQILDGDLNDACTSPEKLTSVSQAAKSRPIIVIPANESLEIAKHAQTLTRTVTL